MPRVQLLKKNLKKKGLKSKDKSQGSLKIIYNTVHVCVTYFPLHNAIHIF